MSIQKKIDLALRNLQSLSMQDFVEISNFDYDYGFYNINEKNKIGTKGHFITSPEISSIFSEAIFNQFIEKNRGIKKIHLFELGPGNGIFTSDILREMQNHDIDVKSVTLLERSSYFREKLKKKFNKIKKLSIIQNINDFQVKDDDLTFIYSNEFFDTFGHKQYLFLNDQFNEILITKKNSKFILSQTHSSNSELLKKEYEYLKLNDKDIIEHSPLIDYFIKTLNSVIKNYCFITNDYGYTENLKKNTLRALKKQKKINLFEHFENIDYSFSVDFKRLSNLFLPSDSIIITQEQLLKKYVSQYFDKSQPSSIKFIINLLSNKMGKVFKNFYVQSK